MNGRRGDLGRSGWLHFYFSNIFPIERSTEKESDVRILVRGTNWYLKFLGRFVVTYIGIV